MLPTPMVGLALILRLGPQVFVVENYERNSLERPVFMAVLVILGTVK